MAEEDQPIDGPVYAAFKKLKVEIEWDEEKLKSHASTVSPSELFLGDRPRTHVPEREEQAERSTLKSPSRSHKYRVQPYSKDKFANSEGILGMEKLSFSREECTANNCPCNWKAKCASGQKSPEKSSLNFVQHAAAQKHVKKSKNCVIQEAKLKLHNKQKDQKVVLRAARLHLSNRVRQMPALSKLGQTVLSPKLGSVKRKVIFGSSGEQAADFQTVAAVAAATSSPKSDSAKATAKAFESEEFQGFRTDPGIDKTSAADGALDLKALRSELEAADAPNGACGQTLVLGAVCNKDTSPSRPQCPLHPGRCPMPCRCSHQARLDDWTDDELACYFEEFVFIPKKMSPMAEMMYT